jgi:hypothetical protein
MTESSVRRLAEMSAKVKATARELDPKSRTDLTASRRAQTGARSCGTRLIGRFVVCYDPVLPSGC